MQADFWHERWQTNTIGFHENKVNPALVKHLPTLALAASDRIFVPLCGKTLDIAWLLSQGFRVAGVELSELAIKQLFADIEVKPTISDVGELRCYTAENIEIYVGDFFALNAQTLAKIAAVYDRASLIALPEDMRVRYSQHLIELSDAAPQMLITVEYDQTVMNGPPFSVDSDEVHRHYGEKYKISDPATCVIKGGLKGRIDATQSVWMLQ